MARSSVFGGAGRAMANRHFRRYWYGMTVMTTGFWASRVALGWLIWELTASPTWLGLVAFAEMVPMILIGPIAGAVVDRLGALRIARIAQSCWAVVMAMFAAATLADLATKEVLILLAVTQGFVSGFSNPSHLAMVAKLVPRQDLSPAVALQSGTVQTGRFIGPAIAGPLIVFSGPGLVFALVACGFAFFVIMLLMLRTFEPEAPVSSSQGLAGDFVDGIRYTLGHFPIRTILLFTIIQAILLRPVIELMPGFADQVFGRGADGLAWLLAASGLGAFGSAIWIAVRGRVGGLTRVYWLNLLISAVSLLAFAVTSEFWPALGLIAIFGFCTNAVSICSQTLLQHAVAGTMRARVMSLLGITFRAVPALGALILGWGQSLTNLASPIVLASVACLLVWLYFGNIMRCRDLARLIEAPPGEG